MLKIDYTSNSEDMAISEFYENNLQPHFSRPSLMANSLDLKQTDWLIGAQTVRT